MFLPLESLLGHEYTICSFDLPHHGNSEWSYGKFLLKEDLVLVLKELAKKHNCSKVSLAAFSLGGRACLSIAELAPELVERMILVAPDGLDYHPVYQFLTGTATGRKLFTSFAERPDKYLSMLDWIYRRKMIDQSRYHFARYFVSTEHSRKFLRNVWLDLRMLMPDKRKVQRNILKHHIPTCIFMGRQDRIIPVKLAEAFAKNIPDIIVEILEKGHRLMDTDTFTRMAKCLS